ncbi:MAG TPA: valine--tRNA ligase [Saprospiraceae bacterium]|nr:valine--tRNA ligase [Saprospirales bacterium]HRQ29170.1 valine--tRNA ligase [Saprospiraceae bacterium]
MEIPSRYQAADIEKKWYAHWMDKNYFHSVPDDREPYTIVIPPPNVTGILHMGHMLNNTIQDVLIRKARLDGKNACWVPGTDHASIATEAKVVRLLREKGIKKSEIDREKFLEHAWEWKELYGGIILKQLRNLGASCDWERTAFTMDEERSKSVIQAFIDLYNKGLIYRGERMINWDPEAKTVLSNEEVLYEEEAGNLYHVKYQITGTDEYIIIATTRPETILGDTAVAVNPKDPRYTHLKGKTVIVPVVNREVPLIFDRYVDMEFGTGALKITPAHDPNDYNIGLEHKLEIIDIFNPDATLSEAARFYVGTDRMEARKLIVQDLEKAELLVKIEPYMHSVGRSERTNVVVEPRLSEQWYVDMKSLAGPALEHVMNDDIEFFPKNQKNSYRHWLENIRDWTISRQLWWGHRIPAYYLESDGKTEIFVAHSKQEAWTMAIEKSGISTLKESDLIQDEDVLDTWFSSWLWPISVFGGFSDKKELDYYYPTTVLVTGWDIIFLWVARMVMAGYEWTGEKPFKHVYFTGMVRDKLRRKMSKSLGNSPDALGLIEEYGADGVRFGMLSSSPAGGDLLFDVKLCEQGRNFSNKIWNAMRLIMGWEVEDIACPPENSFAAKWLEQKLDQLLVELDECFLQYRLSDALMIVYNFVWNDFFSWYLEAIKPAFGKPIDRRTSVATIALYEKILTILHPFMPFISEEVWHVLKERAEGDDCIISRYPKPGETDSIFVQTGEKAKALITRIREIRNSKNLKPKEQLPLTVEQSESIETLLKTEGIKEFIQKLGFLSSLDIAAAREGNNMVHFISGDDKYALEIPVEINIEVERASLLNELTYQEGFVDAVRKKLENERFVNNAPSSVVDIERKKLADGEERIRMIKDALSHL